MLPSAQIKQVTGADAVDNSWPAMPTETEIYILPDGRIVIADLPAELAPLLAELGKAEPFRLSTQLTSSALEAPPAPDYSATDLYGNE